MPSSAIENGLTAQLTNSVTPMPRAVGGDLVQRAEVDAHQHRDDHQPDQDADRHVDARDLRARASARNGAGANCRARCRRRCTARPTRQPALEDAEARAVAAQRLPSDLRRARSRAVVPMSSHLAPAATGGRAWPAAGSTKMRMRFEQELRASENALRFRFVGSRRPRRIRHAPMRGHRLPGPDRADFAGGVVAHGDHEIESRARRPAKLFPGLAAQALGRACGSRAATRARADSPCRSDGCPR